MLEGTDDAVTRVCANAACDTEPHYICDSKDCWDDEEASDFACPCRKSESFRLSVAFSHVDVRDEAGLITRCVKWITVGGMCGRCGVVGLYAQWKVSYAPTAHLYDLA